MHLSLFRQLSFEAKWLHVHSLGFVSLLLCFLLCGCADLFVDAEQKCKVQATKGLKQYQSEKYADAEQTYLTATELAKKSQNALQLPLMLRELARCYSAQKKYKQAEESLKQALGCYTGLEKHAQGTRFDQSVVDERQYETLASLADSCVAQNRLLEAKDAYAKAIALGDKIVEPSSISNQVKQNYINVLEKSGDRELAYSMQRQLDAASCTMDEFDERFATAVKALSAGDYEQAQKEFDTLQLAANGFLGANPRQGKILIYAALMKIIHNSPVEAALLARNAIRIAQSTDYPELSNVYTLSGLASELQGDTTSGDIWYLKAFRTEPYFPRHILLTAEKGLEAFGYKKQAQIVAARIRSFKEDPRFVLNPKVAIEYVLLANEQQNDGKLALSTETRLRGLVHLEHDGHASELGELRGAYQLYKIYSKAGEKGLADRALKQMRLVGGRSEQGQVQLKKALRHEGLPI